MEPAAVADGAAAMDALWHGLALNRPYALVLLDACMPGTSWPGAGRHDPGAGRAGRHPHHPADVGGPRGDRARTRELNIDAHLLKPVPPDELLETIYRVMSRVDGDAPPDAAGGDQTRPGRGNGCASWWPRTTNSTCAHLERLLVRKGHSVRPAYNGREALALLAIGEGPAAGAR